MHLLVIFVSALVFSVTARFSPARRDSAQVITSCTVPKTAALTFDDGPHVYTREIVDMLNAAGGKGTFFVNGFNWGCIYDDTTASDLKYAYDNGFQIGSHTWFHKDLATLPSDEINEEMMRTEDAIRRITGATPAFTRCPFGSYNDEVLNVAGLRSQTLVNWDVDTGDSVGTDPTLQKGVYDEVVGRHPQNILSLQHEVYKSTVREVLPYEIELLKRAGYELVTLADCLGRPPYLSIEQVSSKDENWKC